MAIVVIGGLLASTLLTLVVVPAGYTIMDDFQEWIRQRLDRKPPPLEALAEWPQLPVPKPGSDGREAREGPTGREEDDADTRPWEVSS